MCILSSYNLVDQYRIIQFNSIQFFLPSLMIGDILYNILLLKETYNPYKFETLPNQIFFLETILGRMPLI